MAATKALRLASIGDLDNETRLHILGVIDKLRELGISKKVSLPQACRRWRPVQWEVVTPGKAYGTIIFSNLNPDKPVEILSPEMVADLHDAEVPVMHVAGGNISMSSARHELVGKV